MSCRFSFVAGILSSILHGMQTDETSYKTEQTKFKTFPPPFAMINNETKAIWRVMEKGGESLKFKLIIDKNAEEEITAVVHAASSLTQQIETMVRSYSCTDSITGYREDEMRKLTFQEIECITILNRKVIAIDLSGVHYIIKERLRDLEEILPSYFIRINKSSLANERRITKFDAVISGGVDAVFQCGYRDYVSRRCFSEIKRRYEKK